MDPEAQTPIGVFYRQLMPRANAEDTHAAAMINNGLSQ
jgi:hypothetical protein